MDWLLGQVDPGSFWIGIVAVVVAIVIPSLAAAVRLGRVEQKVNDLRDDMGEVRADLKVLNRRRTP